MNDVIFADHRNEIEDAPGGGDPWLVMIVDDEEDVHVVTRLVLNQVRFEGRAIRMIDAYTGEEAKDALARHPDIALILLDVVMETETAGLKLVEYIRRDLKNSAVRIVLRTGQPGMAPERRVIAEYDINDYKSKVDLTAQKLYTTTLAALRSYGHIRAIEMSRRGLEQIIDGAGALFRLRSLNVFTAGVLTQISALLGVSRDGILCVWDGSPGYFVFASSGEFEPLGGRTLEPHEAPEIADIIGRTMAAQASQYRDDDAALYFDTPLSRRVVVYLRTRRELAPFERQLLEVFCRQVSIGMDNLHLFDDLKRSNSELKRAHKATVLALADLGEYRDAQTGEHVLRVARLAEDITADLRATGNYPEIDDVFVDAIGLASIMHDVGKVTTPDRVLLKPGKLDADEMAIMREHPRTGRDILEKARLVARGSTYLELGATIAHNHHERWDGAGYPRGIAGDAIPLAARIVAVADVFDALTHERVYKHAWPIDEALALMREQRGRHFDPAVIDAFERVIADGGPERYLTLSP
jgi:response regulator RpfG family c-di-GMP phosphodiesterase